MRKAKIPVERVSAPTAEQMVKTLFLECEWDVVKAKRIARLACGDWRKVHMLERLFADASVDVASMSDKKFGEALESMSRNAHQRVHPTLALHQLFRSRNQGMAPEDMVDASVLAWGERNHGILCDSLANMISVQEAAVECDMLTNSGQPQLGMEYWARSAAVHGASNLRYDFAAYANPWSSGVGKESLTTAAARLSFEATRPRLARATQRIAQSQNASETAPAKLGIVKRGAAAKKASAKRAPRGKATQA